MKEISVRRVAGTEVVTSDAIIVKGLLKEYLLNEKENIKIDFKGVKGIDCCFLSCLFTNLICNYGRDYMIEHIEVSNLESYDDYNRVVRGIPKDI